jgi:hypothetical protein
MNPATVAMRDQVAAVLREAAPERLSLESLAGRLTISEPEIHAHLRALERGTEARRSYSPDYLSIYWRWSGPVDLAIGTLEATWEASSGEVR